MDSQPFDDLGALVVGAAVAVVLACLAAAFAWRRRGRSAAVRVGCNVLLVAAVLGVLALTVAPGMSSGHHVNLVPLRGIHGELGKRNEGVGVVNLVGNVLMFCLPGFLTRFALGWSVRRTVAAGLIASLGIEVVQYAQDAGRSSDIDDVVLNSLGAAVGAVLAAAAARFTAGRA